MVSLSNDKRMAHWRVFLDGVNLTREMRDSISSISIEYQVNKPTTATIAVNSYGWLEQFFTPPKNLTILMGWSPMDLVLMFEGQIILDPEGSAADFVQTTITAVPHSKAGTRQRSRVFNVYTKSGIIAQVAGGLGLTPVIQIKDSVPLRADEQTSQQAQTDYQFLAECARKWDCIFWIDFEQNTLYFVDSIAADDVGGSIRLPNPDDTETSYSLGFRSDRNQNNVANVRFRKRPSRIQPGSAGQAKQYDEKGEVPDTLGDVAFFFEDRSYYFTEDFQRQARKDPEVISKAMDLIRQESDQGRAAQALTAGEFDHIFIVSPVGTGRTNKDKIAGAGGGGGRVRNLEVNVDLNVGDPYLRPPRKVRIASGTDLPGAFSSHLPGYLPQEMKIRKVKTWLDGTIRTSMELVA